MIYRLFRMDISNSTYDYIHTQTKKQMQLLILANGTLVPENIVS